MTMEEYCKQLERRVAELERENAELRAQLGLSDTKAASTAPQAEFESSPSATVHKYSSPKEKIQLFRGLFRGREDVFAKRWYSVKTEKSGYSPVCANEWREGVCIKPKGSCSKCENRELVRLSDAIIYEHLSGKDGFGRDVVGLYPILPDDVQFNGVLRAEQQPAAEALLSNNIGVLSATTAFGKTVIAAHLIGQRKVNTLVLVHTQALLNQWKASLSEFLTINEVLPELPKKRGRKKERSVIGQVVSRVMRKIDIGI